jgi:hypothetical protein
MIDNLTRDMHVEHLQWQTDVSLWKDELDLWRKELTRATDDVRRAEQALEAHAQSLDRHTLQLLKEEQEVRRHERAIAQATGDGQGQLVLPPSNHTAEADRHRKARDAHERLKRHHHTILARMSLLLKAIAEPA